MQTGCHGLPRRTHQGRWALGVLQVLGQGSVKPATTTGERMIQAYYENDWICIRIQDTDCHEHEVLTLSIEDAYRLAAVVYDALEGPKPNLPA